MTTAKCIGELRAGALANCAAQTRVFTRLWMTTAKCIGIGELRAGALKFISRRLFGVVAEIYFAPVGGIGG